TVGFNATGSRNCRRIQAGGASGRDAIERECRRASRSSSSRSFCGSEVKPTITATETTAERKRTRPSAFCGELLQPNASFRHRTQLEDLQPREPQALGCGPRVGISTERRIPTVRNRQNFKGTLDAV